jgi:hypothetical protein
MTDTQSMSSPLPIKSVSVAGGASRMRIPIQDARLTRFDRPRGHAITVVLACRGPVPPGPFGMLICAAQGRQYRASSPQTFGE